MILETERLNIRATSREEMSRYIESETDEILRTAYREMLQGCLDHPDEWAWYAIWTIDLKDGTHVGDLSFKGLNANGMVEIGYGVREELRGCGFATEAVGAATAWALRQPGVLRVEAETEPDALASQRVLQKCGFAPSGAVGDEGPRFVRIRRARENEV